MNKVAIFGATGMTGLCVVKSALEKGLQINALLRDPTRLPKEYEGKLNIVKGDVLNIEDVKKTVEGQDGVIVVLGTRNDLNPTTVMSEGLKNILTAMKELKVKTVSVCLSSFLFFDSEKVPAQFHNINAEHQRMLNLLKEESELQWIAVNPPHIADQPPTGCITKHGAHTGHRVISKYDLGQFFVDCLSLPEHYQQVVGIASNPQQ